MSELPAETKPARLKVGVSPRPPWAGKPGTELGAAPTLAVPNPDSRLGLSPHSQGRVMDELSAVFVGIDVSRDRLDVHLRPLGEVLSVPRDAKGLDGLTHRFSTLPIYRRGGPRRRRAAALRRQPAASPRLRPSYGPPCQD